MCVCVTGNVRAMARAVMQQKLTLLTDTPDGMLLKSTGFVSHVPPCVPPGKEPIRNLCGRGKMHFIFSQMNFYHILINWHHAVFTWNLDCKLYISTHFQLTWSWQNSPEVTQKYLGNFQIVSSAMFRLYSVFIGNFQDSVCHSEIIVIIEP